MVLQYLSNAGCEGAKRDSIYEYLKFRRKALYFRRKISQSVETISVTSNFDGYSEVNQLKKVASILATFFSIIFISYSKPASWLSSFRQPPKVLSFLAYRLLSISREQNPGRDCAEWTSPTGSFRYEVHQMQCFHYPPPRYSHRPLYQAPLPADFSFRSL